MKDGAKREPLFDAAESKTPSMRGSSMRENREILATPSSDGGEGRSEKAKYHTVESHQMIRSDY